MTPRPLTSAAAMNDSRAGNDSERAMVSFPPPGGKGAINRIDFTGYADERRSAAKPGAAASPAMNIAIVNVQLPKRMNAPSVERDFHQPHPNPSIPIQ